MKELAGTAIKDGLRVLVTAGASGIGRAIVDAFIEHGARVHICDIADAQLDAFREARPDAGATKADVADPAAVDRLFAEVERRLGGLDVLVNNAGIAGPTARVEEIAIEDWQRTVSVNLNGQFYCARKAAPLLRRNGEGAVINISSVAGRLGYAFRTPYAATKWAIIGFTASLAKELGPDGIRVNAILPGIVEGPRMDKVIAERAKATGISFEEMQARYLEKISLRRMVSPQDVASMALFLCSPAGRNISGQALSVCGNVETL
jgi:NAD(P)-dependent dehydrogenase (short-subunit alcohol dehydrogenase family)